MDQGAPVSPLRSSPPPPPRVLPTTTTTNGRTRQQQQPSQPQPEGQNQRRRRPESWKRRLGFRAKEEDPFENAEEWAHRLTEASEVLLDRLFAYLSTLPEEPLPTSTEDDYKEPRVEASVSSSPIPTVSQGVTLPASALGWLSDQFLEQKHRDCDDMHDDDDEVPEGFLNPHQQDREHTSAWTGVALRDRLRLLRFLLPRITHLRISRSEWPPPAGTWQSRTRRRRNRRQGATGEATGLSTPARVSRPPQEVLNISSTISVASALTMETQNMPPTRNAFCRYIRKLVTQPQVDLSALVPNVKVLVLDGLPPTWITSFTLAKLPALQVLRWNRSCLYDHLPQIVLLSRPICSRRKLFEDPRTRQADESTTQSPNDAAPIMLDAPILPMVKTISNVMSPKPYQSLTHVNLSRCGLGESSGLARVLKQFKMVHALDLSHNELITERTALVGLRSCLRLTHLNLSHNQLTNGLPNAHLYLSGQLRTLDLSHNALTSIVGIQRLFQLKALQLSNNQLQRLSSVSGLSGLPQLEHLDLLGNPMGDLYRISMLQWFQQARQAAVPAELPTLDGNPLTDMEWSRVQEESYVLVPNNSTRRVSAQIVRDEVPSTTSIKVIIPARPPKVTRSRRSHRRRRRQPAASIEQKPAARRKDCRASDKKSSNFAQKGSSFPGRITTKTRKVSFSVEDVLVQLSKGSINDVRTHGDELSFVDEQNSRTPFHGEVASHEPLDEAETNQNSAFPNDLPSNSSPQPESNSTWQPDVNYIPESAFLRGNSLQLAKDMDAGMLNSNDFTSPVPLTLIPSESKSNIAALQHRAGNNGLIDIFTIDWDALVAQAADGLIPNGKVENPVAALEGARKPPVFGDTTTALLLPDSNDVEGKLSVSMDATSQSSLGGIVCQDAVSVASSLGTRQEDTAKVMAFALAEEMSTYGGPEIYQGMQILKSLDLYFSSFVFQTKKPIDDSATEQTEEDQSADEANDWTEATAGHPRIQLWPDDLLWRDRADQETAANGVDDVEAWSSREERFVRVWEESILPCGKPSLRRLASHRRNRLGFHGDQVFVETAPSAYAECRQVIVCLSTKALYIMLKDDPFTTRKQGQRKIKKFPIPLKTGTKFSKAVWPHAVARHSISDLEAVTIGFEFQRVTLRFSNPSLKEKDPYVYVFVMSNKKECVALLQEIQRLFKDVNDQLSDGSVLAMENDSLDVEDALSSAVAPDPMGSISHYQILQQQWKRGERGTVRRVCVVTDSHIYLLDEDYEHDGHGTIETTAINADTNRIGDVSYQMVDGAPLNQVTEVRAADSDPRAITILITPNSALLARTHRWRLVCRDNVGAERLVEAVRKAMPEPAAEAI